MTCSLATMLALAGPASAQPDTGRAQALFAEGRAAMEKGDYPTACARFSASLAIVQRAGTLLNLAQCEQHEGRFANALKHWQEGAALLPAGDDRLAVAKERMATLGARVPRLTVKLDGPAPPGARIEVDGLLVQPDQLAAGMLLDPGRHAVVLLVPGAPDQRSTVDLAEKESKSVTLAVPNVSPKTEPPRGGGSSGLRTGGFVLLGVGAAGFVVAGVTGGVLLSKHSTIEGNCNFTTDVCNAAGLAARDSTPPLNAANAAGWVVGLAGLAGGVALVAVGSRATVAPAPLPNGGGLWTTWRF